MESFVEDALLSVLDGCKIVRIVDGDDNSFYNSFFYMKRRRVIMDYGIKYNSYKNKDRLNISSKILFNKIRFEFRDIDSEDISLCLYYIFQDIFGFEGFSVSELNDSYYEAYIEKNFK